MPNRRDFRCDRKEGILATTAIEEREEDDRLVFPRNKGGFTTAISKTPFRWFLVVIAVFLLAVLGNINNEDGQFPSSRAQRLLGRDSISKQHKEIQESATSIASAVSSIDASKSLRDGSIQNVVAKTSLFKDFVRKHKRIYANREEYNRRERIFHESLSTVLHHNTETKNAQVSWKMGMNMFADHSQEELPLGLDKWALRNRHRTKRAVATTTGNTKNLSPLPESVDWRKQGVTTPVKNQGHCGSCWAFASTAALESHIAIQTGKLFELSVQELVTCAPNPDNCGGTGGCGGNTAELAYEFVSSGRGIVTEWQWGYTSGTNHTVPSCELPPDNSTIDGAVASIEGYIGLEHNDYNSLLEAVATVGPVVVNVDAANWRLYKSGIFEESLFSNSTTRDINHVVVVEGYGTEMVADPITGVKSPQDYWLVRNSWGPLWGEDGYIRLKRDSKAASNDCKPDVTPADGIACVGPDNQTIPPVVDVCGTSGVLYDALYPTGGHLLKKGASSQDWLNAKIE